MSFSFNSTWKGDELPELELCDQRDVGLGGLRPDLTPLFSLGTAQL